MKAAVTQPAVEVLRELDARTSGFGLQGDLAHVGGLGPVLDRDPDHFFLEARGSLQVRHVDAVLPEALGIFCEF